MGHYGAGAGWGGHAPTLLRLRLPKAVTLRRARRAAVKDISGPVSMHSVVWYACVVCVCVLLVVCACSRVFALA